MRLRRSIFSALATAVVACGHASPDPIGARTNDASVPRSSSAQRPFDAIEAVRAQLPSYRRREPLRRADDGRITTARPAIDPTMWRRKSLEVALADTADGPMRLWSADLPDAWIEVRDVDARSVAADTIDARSAFFSGVREGVDVVHLVDGPREEELRVVASNDDAIVTRYEVTLGPAIASLRVKRNRLEAIDANGSVLLSTEDATAIGADGRTRDARVTIDGDGVDARGRSTARVRVTLDGRGMARPIVVDPSWTTVGAMNVRRARAATVRLNDGRVLAVGGAYQDTFDSGDQGATDSAEIFTPIASGGSWSLVETSTGDAAPTITSTLGYRENAASIVLDDGTVLIDGGGNGLVRFTPLPASAPTLGTFTSFATKDSTGAPIDGVTERTFVRLANGKIFTAGGILNDGTTQYTVGTSFLIDGSGATTTVTPSTPLPALAGSDAGTEAGTEAGTDAGATPTVRNGAVSVALQDGLHVLFCGGQDASEVAIQKDCWIFDATTSTWRATSPSQYLHYLSFAALLPNGQIFVSGRWDQTTDTTEVPEIYDPTSEAWSDASAIPESSFMSGAAVANQVVLFANVVAPTPDSTAVVFDVFARTFAPLDPLPTDFDTVSVRIQPSVAVLWGNRVLVAGGANATNDGAIFDSTEIYRAPAPTSGDTYCAVSGDCFGDAGCDGGFCGGAAPTGDAAADTSDTGPDTIDAGSDTIDAGPDTMLDGSDIGDAGTDTIDAGSDIGDTGPDTMLDGPDTGDAFEPTGVVSGDFTNCSVDSDCASGHCVDQVCCDTACAAPCHSCALPTSPGNCAVEPTGFDLRDDCSHGASCLSTCGPGGTCVAIVAGNTCAPAACIDSVHVQAAAVCAAQGAACPTTDLATLDCTPYICAQALRACLTECVSSDECVDGYICDVTSKTCVTTNAQTSSGCSIVDARDRTPSTTAFEAFALSTLAALIGVGRRNARRAIQRRSC